MNDQTQQTAETPTGAASALDDGLERTVIIENANGVQIRKDSKFCGHYKAANAVCECGCELIVAPAIYHPDHKKGDPVMVCSDHGVHGYRFTELVQGKQPAGSAHRG